MGDRVLVTVRYKDHSGEDAYSVGIYGHWLGDHAVQILKDAEATLRAHHPTFLVARICGAFCAAHEENHLGVGIFPAPKPDQDGVVDWHAYSHGGAGIIVVDADTGECICHAGYLEERDGGVFSLTLVDDLRGEGA